MKFSSSFLMLFTGISLFAGLPARADEGPGSMWPNQVEVILTWHAMEVFHLGQRVNYADYCPQAIAQLSQAIQHARIVSSFCENGWEANGTPTENTYRLHDRIHLRLELERPVRREDVMITVPVDHPKGWVYPHYDEAFQAELDKWSQRPDFVLLRWNDESKFVEGDSLKAKAEAWLLE